MSKDFVSKEDVFKVSCMLEDCGLNFISGINAELDDKKEPWYKRYFKAKNSQSKIDYFTNRQAFRDLQEIAENDYFKCATKYGGSYTLFSAMIAVINRDEYHKTNPIGRLILSLANISFIKAPSFNSQNEAEYKNITSYYQECQLKAKESIKKQNMGPKTLTNLQITILASLISRSSDFCKKTLSEEAFTSFCKIRTELAILAEKKHQESFLPPVDQILKNKYVIAMLFDSDLPDSLLAECACLCASIENSNSDYRNTEFVLRKYKNALFILDEVLNRASQDAVQAPQKEEVTKAEYLVARASLQSIIYNLQPYEQVVLRELLEEKVNQLTPTENLMYDCERLATQEGLRSVRINNITINCRLNND